MNKRIAKRIIVDSMNTVEEVRPAMQEQARPFHYSNVHALDDDASDTTGLVVCLVSKLYVILGWILQQHVRAEKKDSKDMNE
uniref:Actin-related protein 2/3 complex subunit 5 n=1 Tax=Steinernema glaseri TaxID=37863 RepID=A0A1I7YBV7_9BILA